MTTIGDIVHLYFGTAARKAMSVGDGQTQDAVSPPSITGADLYGKSGQPRGSDITQAALGDCYLISTMGQYADRQPDVIRNAIHYDARDQTFGVSLHDPTGQSRTVTVTQDDLRRDRTFGPGGAGGVDSPNYWASTHTDRSSPPAWPSVMEVAYAKLNASSPNDTTSADLDKIAHGGWPKNAIQALSGQTDTQVVQASGLRDTSKAYDTIESAINEHRPILLATNPMKDMPNDGLVRGIYQGPNNPNNSGNAYTVENVSKDKDGHVELTLRNPWGTNNNPLQGVHSPDPVVHVDLKTILDNGHCKA